MAKNIMKPLFYGAIIFIGLLIIMNSINLGNQDVYIIMGKNGGGMDTSTYLIYLEQSITKYRVVGIILSVLGGLGVLINTSVRVSKNI